MKSKKIRAEAGLPKFSRQVVYAESFNTLLDDLVNNLVYKVQPTPVNSNTDPTPVLGASLLGGIMTATPGGAINYTLCTGTQMQAAIGNLIADQSFEVTLINIGAGGTITMVAAAGFTIVGLTTVAANTSARFKIRNTDLNTFVAYRMN